jgi:hypothetical protein
MFINSLLSFYNKGALIISGNHHFHREDYPYVENWSSQLITSTMWGRKVALVKETSAICICPQLQSRSVPNSDMNQSIASGHTATSHNCVAKQLWLPSWMFVFSSAAKNVLTLASRGGTACCGSDELSQTCHQDTPTRASGQGWSPYSGCLYSRGCMQSVRIGNQYE